MDDPIIDASLWEAIACFFERSTKMGAKPHHDFRLILSAITWILKTGSPWKYLPRLYPPRSTCHYWHQKWSEDGTYDLIFDSLTQLAESLGFLNLKETFIDATFVRNKGGSALSGKTKCGKGCKLVAIVDAEGRPVSLHLDSAQPHEITLVHSTLSSLATFEKPKKIIGDKAYDSDAHDQELEKQGIELIAPHKKNRKNKTQDGRKLRPYKRRWKVERFFAHLHNYRRTVIRYEKKPLNFLGFILCAATHIIARLLG